MHIEHLEKKVEDLVSTVVEQQKILVLMKEALEASKDVIESIVETLKSH